MKNLAGQQVLVLGLGASGLALARWCVRCGSSVTVADTRETPPGLAALRQELPEARFVAGDFAALMANGQDFDLVLRSPGLSPAEIAPVMQPAQARGVACGNELTLFAQALRELGALTGPAAEAPSHSAIATAAPDDLAGAIRAGDALAEEADVEEADVAEADFEAAALDDEDTQDSPGESPALSAVLGSEAQDAEELQDAPLVMPPAETQAYRPRIVAITGTNGKTTVTSLTGQLVQRAGKSVAVAGNIGPTLLDTLSACIDSGTLPEVWVLELSSFQLDEVTGFEPTVATVLNISQDHLDWHGSMAAYVRAKSAVYGSQGVMLLNRDDPQVMAALPVQASAPLKPQARKSLKGKPAPRSYQTFGQDPPQRPGDYGIETVNGMAWLVRAAEADETVKRRRDEEIPLFIQRLMPVDALHIRGRHNASNALAALGLALAAGCPLAPLLHGLRDYRGEPHRLESIGVVQGVEYFDDSKGTNVGATVAALNGLGPDRRLVLILGGEGKGQDFNPLAGPVARYVRAAVLIGRDAPLIRAALEATGVELLAADSMAEAVAQAASRAQPGDAVLMSPACASFDMFDNYGHRARVFCEAVQALAQDAGGVL
jgi:UDP-N-acetylmuramoylalanine--D-glutamate ligase